MRKLASVQEVIGIESIPGRDRVVLAKVLGWQSVVRKGEFKVGDRVVFVEPDAILPFAEWSEFLRDKKRPEKPIRIRTLKLCGVLSQGVIFPLSILNGDRCVGTDVTEHLGIKKWEPYVEPFCKIKGEILRPFPRSIPKTDETRIQSVPDLLQRHKDELWYGTEKLDGCSATFGVVDGEFLCCSRNIVLKEEGGNVFWEIAKKYCLNTRVGQHILQGEIIGPGIQGNKYNLKEYEFYAFNVFNLEKQSYYGFHDFVSICNAIGVKTVPVVCSSACFLGTTVDDLLKMSEFKSTLNPLQEAEGIVWRPYTEGTDSYLGRLSFKVINNNFLLLDK